MSVALPPLAGPRAEKSEPTAREFAQSIVNPRTLRVWGVKSAVSVLDQGLSSFAGFAVNLLLARWMKPEVYGAFAVVFAVYLFLTGFHNVLLLEPMSVLGPARYQEDLPTYFRSQIRVHFWLTAGLAVVLLIVAIGFALFAPGSLLTSPSVAGGICFPALLLILLLRRMCYILQRPQEAVYGSSLYVGVVLLGLFSLRLSGWLQPGPVFFLLGLSSLLAAALLSWRLGLFARPASAVNRLRATVTLSENWNYGRWLVASTILLSLTNQTQMFLAAGFLGLGAAGVLRAMQLPMLVTMQIIAAASLLFLPVLSSDFQSGRFRAMRRKAHGVSLALAGLATVFAIVLVLVPGPIERLLFAGKFAPYASLMPLLCLIPVFVGLATGFSLTLRGSQKPQFDLVANAVAAPAGIISAFFFMRWWGIAGAAASLAIAFAVQSIATYGCYLSFRADSAALVDRKDDEASV